MGALNVRIATLIHDKAVGGKVFGPLLEIACALYDELCAKFDHVFTCDCPWAVVPSPMDIFGRGACAPGRASSTRPPALRAR